MAKRERSWVLGYFRDPAAFQAACSASHAAGHHDQQAYTPYPIHGLEKRLGLRRSWIGRPVLFMLLFGAFLGFMMQLWMMKYDWPLIIAGKPFNSWPAFVVITFESGILLGALSNLLICLLIACRLLPATETRLPSPRLTDDTFLLAVPADGNHGLPALDAWMRGQHPDEVVQVVPDLAAAAEPSHA